MKIQHFYYKAFFSNIKYVDIVLVMMTQEIFMAMRWRSYGQIFWGQNQKYYLPHFGICCDIEKKGYMIVDEMR